MNNSKLLYVVLVVALIMSCTRQQMPTPEGGNQASNGNSAAVPGTPTNFNALSMARFGAGYSKPIPVDSANKMIMSYLNSINYGVNTNAPRSLIFDADTLRAYLNDSSKGKITSIKFMFAHQMDYINSGKEGKLPDSNTNAITMIIVGFDQNNNYVLNKNNMVYDNMAPCPYVCPPFGTAAYNIIQ